MEGAKFSANAGRKGESGGMRPKSLHLNAMGGRILNQDELGYTPFIGLSTYSQSPQRERKKGAKKERETTAAIFNQKGTFLSCAKEDISILR